jgi:hypothetical protein
MFVLSTKAHTNQQASRTAHMIGRFLYRHIGDLDFDSSAGFHRYDPLARELPWAYRSRERGIVILDYAVGSG